MLLGRSSAAAKFNEGPGRAVFVLLFRSVQLAFGGNGVDMKTFSKKQHLDALLKRRIKFVVEKGAMARLFRCGTHSSFQRSLFTQLKPARIVRIRSQRQYDAWLSRTVRLRVWARYSQNGVAADRWAYFAKLINILVYEIIANRELVAERDWKRLRPFIHVPVDARVLDHLCRVDRNYAWPEHLKGMSGKDYRRIQDAVRRVAKAQKVPPIWFEAAWSL